MTRSFTEPIELNLNGLQQTLAAQAADMVQRQEASKVSRKALADQTKDFRKLPEEEKLASVKGLLKAYQGEIDTLSTRARHAETAYVSVFRMCSDVTDPLSVLRTAMTSLAGLTRAVRCHDEEKRVWHADRASIVVERDTLREKLAAVELQVCVLPRRLLSDSSCAKRWMRDRSGTGHATKRSLRVSDLPTNASVKLCSLNSPRPKIKSPHCARRFRPTTNIY